MEDDGLGVLFKNRRLGAATISKIRNLDLKAEDLLALSPQFLGELCKTVGASDDERFKIFAAVGAAKYSEVTGIRTFGSQSEGLNARLYISERKDLLEKLERLVHKEGAVIVRAPPQSGKTSLLQLLKDRTESTFSDVFYISLAGINDHSLEYVWYRHYPHVPIERLNSSEPTLLLVDEGQSGFHAPDLTLWAKIKSAQAGAMLHIVLVSSFCSDEGDTDEGELPPTPIIFNPSCAVTIRPQHGCGSSGLYLQFSDAECMELWENWCKFCAFVPSNNDILYYVMEVGDRQPGLMTHMLDWLVKRKFNDKNRGDCEEFAKTELLSKRFTDSLSEIRSISTFRKMYWQPEYAGVLSKLLGSSSLSVILMFNFPI